MSALPAWSRLVLAVVLVGTMALAFWGRPPRGRPRPGLWRGLAAAGVGCYGIGCGALVLDETAICAALVGAGVETLSLVAWLGRGDGEEGDDGGGGEGPGGDGGPPDRWRDDDEREFWDYVGRERRPRDLVPG